MAGDMAVRKNGGRGPSIHDVARFAGVSVSTVSRYLNERDRVSTDRQERIANAISKLNYHPSAVAQAFSRGTMRSVAVLVSSLRLYGPMLTVAGVESQAARAGYSVSILTLEDVMASGSDARESGPLGAAGSGSLAFPLDASGSSLATRISAQSPVGVILVEYDRAGQDARRLVPEQMPCVSLRGDRDETGRRQVSLASYQGGKAVTEHLLGLGHRTVYHVSVPAREAGAGRLDGWRAALAEHRAFAPEPLEATWDPMSGYEMGRRLAEVEDCTAVFVGNDEIAMGVIAGLSAAGKRVPEDVSVAGLDDHPLGRVCMPPLTTYRLRFEDAGAVAFDALVAGRDAGVGAVAGAAAGIADPADGVSNVIELPGELVVRGSTAPLR